MLEELKSANKLLRAGAYAEAVKRYNSLKSAPGYDEIITWINFNIEFCERRLAKTTEGTYDYEEAIDPIGENQIRLGFDYSKLLNVEIGKATYNLERKDYINIKNAVKGHDVGPESFVSICIAITVSPFQVELYKLLLRFVKFNDKAVRSETSTRGIMTCLDILNMCNSSLGWLVNRRRLQQHIEQFKVADPRAKRLTLVDPSQPDYKYVSSSNLERKNMGDSIGLGTILLNEEKYIFDNLMQHYDFCDQWALVEGACLGYPERKVSSIGLSLDRTSDLIQCFPDPAGKLIYIQHGWTKKGGEDAKSELRNRYLQVLSTSILVVVDADEFYLKNEFDEGIYAVKNEKTYAVTLPQVHFWKTISQFITGEYYDISHTRIYKNLRGMKYIRNHNFPEIGGKLLTEMGHFKFKRTIDSVSEGVFTYREPKCFHMGFAKDHDDMKDKSDYYVNRGEKVTRASTTQSRSAWFDGDLPEKCRLRGWGGPIPEAIGG